MPVTVIAPETSTLGVATFPLSPISIAFAAGCVQNTSLVPTEKGTKVSLFELEITVVLERVSGVASVTVPIPTSNSVEPGRTIQ